MEEPASEERHSNDDIAQSTTEAETMTAHAAANIENPSAQPDVLFAPEIPEQTAPISAEVGAQHSSDTTQVLVEKDDHDVSACSQIMEQSTSGKKGNISESAPTTIGGDHSRLSLPAPSWPSRSAPQGSVLTSKPPSKDPFPTEDRKQHEAESVKFIPPLQKDDKNFLKRRLVKLHNIHNSCPNVSKPSKVPTTKR